MQIKFMCLGLNKFYIFVNLTLRSRSMESDVESKREQFESQDHLEDDEESRNHLRPKQALSQEDIQELFLSQSKLLAFIQQINQLKDSTLRNDVLEHCQRTKLKLNQHYSVESIQKMVKNRIEKMIKNKRLKKNWSEEDVKILIWIISKYSDFKGHIYIEKDLTIEDWEYIASIIPGVQTQGCMFKWLSLKKNNLTEHAWGQRQSQLLERIVKKYGEKDWSLISQKLYFMNSNPHKIYRCAKQCREHWNCYLNPNLKKGPWTKEEDLLLLTIIKKNKCQKRWAEMVGHFKGRTQNALKNRYTLILDKQMKQHSKSHKLTQLKIIEEFLEKSYVQQFVDDQHKKNGRIGDRMKTRQRQALEQKKNISEEIENIPLNPMNGSEFDKTGSNPSGEEQMPSIEKISIVTLKQDQIKDLMDVILSEKSDYVPCAFDNNKLKKISKI